MKRALMTTLSQARPADITFAAASNSGLSAIELDAGLMVDCRLSDWGIRTA
ncbi:MAG: hypothetical protein KC502_07350 [Myxococcales bacterium]|nr:hypothetical protein [Myxococcales bacterium]